MQEKSEAYPHIAVDNILVILIVLHAIGNIDSDLLLQQPHRLLAHVLVVAIVIHLAEIRERLGLLDDLLVLVIQTIVAGELSEDVIRQRSLIKSLAVIPSGRNGVDVEVDLVCFRHLVLLKDLRSQSVVWNDTRGRSWEGRICIIPYGF